MVKKIRMVLEDLKEESIRGLLLSFTGDYYPSKIQIIMNFFQLEES